MERLKALRRRRDMLPHRESLNFLMGGHKISLSERLVSLFSSEMVIYPLHLCLSFFRFDVMRELNQLKCVVLPSKAKDLYVGRGFSDRLPR